MRSPLILVFALIASLGLLLPAAYAHGPFDALGGLAVYGTGWEGDYTAIGLGGRARAELGETIGVDVFAELADVEIPDTVRRDLVIGFDLYVPFSPLPGLRLRPLFGFCADFSFVDPHHDLAPRSDDIGFGVHAGAGAEVGLGQDWSVFADVQQVAWFGHDRSASAWTGTLDGDIELSTLTQGRVGIQLHLF